VKNDAGRLRVSEFVDVPLSGVGTCTWPTHRGSLDRGEVIGSSAHYYMSGVTSRWDEKRESPYGSGLHLKDFDIGLVLALCLPMLHH
jgi:hypothetical protein